MGACETQSLTARAFPWHIGFAHLWGSRMASFGPFVGVVRDDIDAINTIAAFLAKDEPADPATDIIVLAGNAMLWTLEAAAALARTLRVPLLISGGRGHSTALLQEAIAQHPLYAAQTGDAEAILLRDLAVRFLGLQPQQIIVEAESTNCAENALFAKRALAAAGIRPACLTLIQDPLMQRRTEACFRRAFDGEACPRIVNGPVWVPQLVTVGSAIAFRDPPGSNIWSAQRFMELLLGEVARLRDDENGYGPRGRGYIPHVDIPAPVEQAFRHLTSCGRFAAAAGRLPG